MFQQMTNLPLEVIAVHRIDFAGDLELHVYGLRDLNCPIDPLFGGNSSLKSQITSLIFFKIIKMQRNPVIDGSEPVDPQKRSSLVVGDGNHRHVAELTIKRG